MSEEETTNGTAHAEAEEIQATDTDRLNEIGKMLVQSLNNDAIIAQALAMILAGAAKKVLLVPEVEEMIRRLDPDAKFESASPILRGVPMPGRH